MAGAVLVWIEFAVCVALISVAGLRLIRYADVIAARTGLSRSWVGLILIATVTSLPELVTGLSAVTVANAPDIAVGDALGSCVFNLTILALVDVFHRQESIYAMASREHVLPASLGVLLLTTVALILTLSALGSVPRLGHVSLGSVALIALYLLAMRQIHVHERRRHLSSSGPTTSRMSLKSAVMGYAVASVVIIGSGIWLPFLGVELARIMGWSNSFVGTLFVAMATSVPEVATTVAALRIGALDLLIGNLLGSNLFDVLILAVDDVAYRAGSLYEHVSPLQTVSAMTAAIMTGAVIVALTYRPVSRVLRLGSWASVVMLALYLLNALAQFWHGH